MFFVYAPETNSLLTKVTGAFDELDLDIIEARLHMSSNGFALYSFNAVVPEKSEAIKADYMQFLEQRVRTLILSNEDEKIISRGTASRALKHFPIEPKVNFHFNHDNYTTMVVTAQNQPGFLHNVALVLKRHGDHTPVLDAQLLDQLDKQLCEALDRSS